MIHRLAAAAALVLMVPVLFIGAGTGAVLEERASNPVPGVACGTGTSGPTPAVQRFRTELLARFPDMQSLGICDIRKTRGPYASGQSWSQHAYCNAEDWTRPGAPATLGPVLRWMEANRERLDVAHLLTYPAGSGLEHVIHIDFHPKRTGDPHGRSCEAGELEAAALSHPRISWRPDAAGDVGAGRIDPRVLQVLLHLAERHHLGPVGPLITGHSYFVAGTTRPSNHAFGRAVDIGGIDGRPVSPSNPEAREAMEAILELPPALLPDELGGPWMLPHPSVRVFTKDHHDHLHVGWSGKGD